MTDLREVAADQGVVLSPAFEAMIASWHLNDPKGMRARYPTNRNYEPTLLLNGTAFHLQAFKQEAEDALEVLHDLLAIESSEQYKQILREAGIAD